ncbi:UNVERIFIED_CONTAM: hypothetical protein H355_010071 [Colinus virginianus]|nr:hypothetical protein H355_010071 [Colinus virginianus]
MRAVLWDLLLLCLFARARSDCRGDCLRCDRHFYRDGFDLLIPQPQPVRGAHAGEGLLESLPTSTIL